MNIIQFILLGILQGLTEFLPISSSGHLVLLPALLHWNIPEEKAFVFNILVQVATLLAVIIYFWKDLEKIILAVFNGIIKSKPFEDSQARLGWYIVLATIPAGLAGLLIKDVVEEAFSSPTLVAIFLLITAMLLVVSERIGKRQRDLQSMNWLDALMIGIGQILAIFPGISRSGATISTGMARNFNRESAARFSFLMSIPIMLAAGSLAMLDLLAMPQAIQWLPEFIPGFIASAITGYLSIRWLLKFLVSRTLYGFSIYCALFGLISLLLLNIK